MNLAERSPQLSEISARSLNAENKSPLAACHTAHRRSTKFNGGFRIGIEAANGVIDRPPLNLTGLDAVDLQHDRIGIPLIIQADSCGICTGRAKSQQPARTFRFFLPEITKNRIRKPKF